jgi:hypothetical protein
MRDIMYKIAGGEIIIWAESGTPIMLKVNQKYGDPVELCEHEAQELIDVVAKLLEESRALRAP